MKKRIRDALVKQPEAARTSDLPAPEDAVTRLKTLIEERRSETVEVLRSWLDEPQAGDAR